jgi:hypothetical protein
MTSASTRRTDVSRRPRRAASDRRGGPQSIYFEDLDGVLRCLDAVAADPAVRLLRVNNRLHGGYDAALTAGYRDLSLNLRVETAETRRLLVHAHVCEVQLVLVRFARIKVCPTPFHPIPRCRCGRRAQVIYIR